MRLHVKKLQGGECYVDVLPTTVISEVKRDIESKLGIPVEEQKLLLMGRPLADEQTVQSYPAIKDGTKLNLIVKKPETLYDASYKYYKKCGINDKDASSTAKRFVKLVDLKFSKMSWDDINKLAEDCLLEEAVIKKGQKHNVKSDS